MAVLSADSTYKTHETSISFIHSGVFFTTICVEAAAACAAIGSPP